MKRFSVYLLALAGIGASVFGLLTAHNLYQSVWLDLYLALFVAFPGIRALSSLPGGVKGYVLFFKYLFPAIIDLVAMTLTYHAASHNWLNAFFAGAISYIIAYYLRNALRDGESRVAWSFFVDGVVVVGGLELLFRLWGVKGYQGPLPVIGGLGLIVVLWIYSNYIIPLVASRRSLSSFRAALAIAIFTLAVVLLILSAAKLALDLAFIHFIDFPFPFNTTLARLTPLAADWPNWAAPAGMVGALMLLIFSVVIVNRRPDSTWRANSARRLDNTRSDRSFEESLQYLAAQEWSQAIEKLSRLNESEADVERQKYILFSLAFAQYMENHLPEAREHLRDLLGLDARHKEGLYLTGYIALQSNLLNEAEDIWQKLVRIDQTFRPDNDGIEACYYLSLTLYKKAMAQIDRDFEAAVALLSEAGKIGALEKEIADVLIHVYLYNCTQLIRQRKWSEAAQEVNRALQHLGSLDQTEQATSEMQKLAGFCHTMYALIAMKQERYSQAVANLITAEQKIEPPVHKEKLFERPGQTFMDQLLQALQEAEQSSKKGISPLFIRDMYFLAGITSLHELYQQLDQHPGTPWLPLTKKAEEKLEASLTVSPDFDEGRAILGLLYYYLGTDQSQRGKGIELLRSVYDRIGSSFVRATLKEYDTRKQLQEDARKAYFDLLGKYLHSSSIPQTQRKEMRVKAIKYMKATGEWAQFVDDRTLAIEREQEHEPTVTEYRENGALLRQKLKELIELDPEGEKSSRVKKLIDSLNNHNTALQKTINDIEKTEQDLLAEAQNLL